MAQRVKNTHPPPSTYRCRTISNKISIVFFVEIEKFILKSISNFKGPQIAKSNLKKKNKVGVLIVPNFEHTTKPQESKQLWHKDRHKNQRNRIQIPEINPHIYG